MKKFNLISMLFTSLVIISSCDNKAENSVQEDNVCQLFDNKISISSLTDSVIVFPDLNVPCPESSDIHKKTTANGSLIISWTDMIEAGNQDTLAAFIPIRPLNRMFIVRQELYHHNSRIIVSPIYSYLKLCTGKNIDKVNKSIVSFCPDYRFLKKYESDFSQLLATNNIMNEFTGMVFYSDFKGNMERGLLLVKGKDRCLVSPNFTSDGKQTYVETVLDEQLRKLKFYTREFAFSTRSDSTETDSDSSFDENEWPEIGFTYYEGETTVTYCGKQGYESCSCTPQCQLCASGFCECYPACSVCDMNVMDICIRDKNGNCKCDSKCSTCETELCNCENCPKEHPKIK